MTEEDSLFGGGRDGLHVGRSFLGSRRYQAVEFLRAFRGHVSVLAEASNSVGRRGYRFDDLADRCLETGGELDACRTCALRGGAAFGLLLLTLQRMTGQSAIHLEHIDGPGHVADLVAALDA